MKKKTLKISPIQFNPQAEHSFWFWRNKFNMVFEMLALLIDYEFTDGEMEENLSNHSIS